MPSVAFTCQATAAALPSVLNGRLVSDCGEEPELVVRIVLT